MARSSSFLSVMFDRSEAAPAWRAVTSNVKNTMRASIDLGVVWTIREGTRGARFLLRAFMAGSVFAFFARQGICEKRVRVREVRRGGRGFLPNAAGVVARARSWHGVLRRWRFGATRAGDRQTSLLAPIVWWAEGGVLCRNGAR